MDTKSLKENLIHKMYKKDIQEILRINQLPYNIVDNNDLFIIKEDKPISNDALTVGGACIDRCDAQVSKLAMNFYFDILNPIEFAISKGTKVAIYVDTPIEVFGSDPNNFQKWIKLSNAIESFLNKLSELLDIKINIIRREKGIDILDNLVLTSNFDNNQLKGLYDMVPSQKNAYFSNELLLHFRRSICSYLPEYLSQYLSTQVEEVIVVEEFSQTKAIYKAQKINKLISSNVYIDLPSLSGKNRMHRSSHGKVSIFSSIDSYPQSDMFKEFINKIEFPNIYSRFGVNDFESLARKMEGLWDEK